MSELYWTLSVGVNYIGHYLWEWIISLFWKVLLDVLALLIPAFCILQSAWGHPNGRMEYKCRNYPKMTEYSKILLLRPPKIKTNSPLKSIFKKCESFFWCVFCTQCLLERDHLWDCSKVVFKTIFEQLQRWSYYRNFTVICQKKYKGNTVLWH